MAAIVLLGKIVRRRAPPPHINRVRLKCRNLGPIIQIQQASPGTCRLPPLEYLLTQIISLDLSANEPQLMRVGVPAAFTVGQLQRSDQPLVPSPLAQPPPRPARSQALQRRGLLLQEVLQLVPLVVWESQRDHDWLQMAGVGPINRAGNLLAPAFLNLRRAHWTAPHRATRHQPAVERAGVLLGGVHAHS